MLRAMPPVTLRDTPPATRRKSQIARIRRMAERQHLEFHISPRRDPYAFDYQAMWLADDHGAIAFGDPTRGPGDPDAVEKWLTREDR